MISKTPKFDAALDGYFSKLTLDEHGGQWRVCRFSGEKFYIHPEDIEFYKRVNVPLPTLAPKERIRKKIAFHNSYNLFKVISALSGETIVSQYPPLSPYPIYEHRSWFGEQWDPLAFGVPYTSSGKTFFEQFKELQTMVPRPSLDVDSTNTDSDYTNWSVGLKRCYLVFDSWQAEDSAYGIAIDESRECFDSFTAVNSEGCSNCFESSNLYHCFFVEYSKDCLDSSFLFDCRNCNHCFMCTNLRHKNYYFFNKPLSKEQYEEKIKSFDCGKNSVVRDLERQFSELKRKAIYKENYNDRSVGSSGNYLKNCKNCRACFYMVDSEDNAYSVGGLKVKDAYDSFGGAESEFIYDSHAGIHSYGLKFSFNIRESRNTEYCDYLVNCRDCFGCIGLKNKSFCVLNVQYNEHDYWRMVDDIKASMLEKGEYGEFFPPFLAAVPYNISVAMSYRGYDDVETAQRYGYRVAEIVDTLQGAQGVVIPSKELPDDIRDVDDSVLQKIILDEKNQKQFRYTKQELEFSRKSVLPLPHEHPSVRLEEKRKKFGTVALEFFKRPCMKCGKSMDSIYSSDRPEIVYCESCYNTEVV